MGVLENIFYTGRTGFSRYFIPFILVLTIFYFVMRTSNIFNSKRVDLAISVILSVVVAQFKPFMGGGFFNYIYNLFGFVAVVTVFLVSFFLFEGLFLGGSAKEVLRKNSGRVLKVLAGSILLVFFMAGGHLVLSGQSNVLTIDFFMSRYEVLSVVFLGVLTALVVSRLK